MDPAIRPDPSPNPQVGQAQLAPWICASDFAGTDLSSLTGPGQGDNIPLPHDEFQLPPISAGCRTGLGCPKSLTSLRTCQPIVDDMIAGQNGARLTSQLAATNWSSILCSGTHLKLFNPFGAFTASIWVLAFLLLQKYFSHEILAGFPGGLNASDDFQYHIKSTMCILQHSYNCLMRRT